MGKTRGRENDTKGKDQKKHMDRSVKESEESLMGIRSNTQHQTKQPIYRPYNYAQLSIHSFFLPHNATRLYATRTIFPSLSLSLSTYLSSQPHHLSLFHKQQLFAARQTPASQPAPSTPPDRRINSLIHQLTREPIDSSTKKAIISTNHCRYRVKSQDLFFTLCPFVPSARSVQKSSSPPHTLSSYSCPPSLKPISQNTHQARLVPTLATTSPHLLSSTAKNITTTTTTTHSNTAIATISSPQQQPASSTSPSSPSPSSHQHQQQLNRTSVMMVGHDLASYAQNLPQPPLSPPPMHPKDSSSSSSSDPHLHSYHRHIPYQQQHPRPVFFHSSSTQRASSPACRLRTDYPTFSTAFSSPSLSSSSPSSSSSASPSSYTNNNSATNLPSSSTLSSILRLPPPRPSSTMSNRLPVRLGLGDPRLQSYMISAKPTSASSSATASTSTSSSFGRQDRIPAAGVTAPGGSYSSETAHSGIGSGSNAHHHHAIPPFHPSSSSPSTSATTLARPALDQGPSSRTYSESSPPMRQASISHSDNGLWSDKAVATAGAGGRHSTSPGSQPRSLPSPTPSMTSMSPDWQVVGRHSHDPSHQQQHAQHRTHQQHDLLSPSASEMELGSDTKPLTPLFRSNSPPAFNNSMSHRPSSSASHLGAAHMTNSQSASSNRSAGTSGVVHPNPALDHRAVTPPATSLGWSTKHHHHRIPVRSPDRAGHELLTTSTTDSEPSAYMNMNFYDIYRQNPKLLRPEGGRHEERRLQAFHHHQGNTHYHPHPDSAHGGDYSRPIGHAKRSSAGGFGGLSRRQSMPLISMATQRVLRHEDAKVEQQMSYEDTGDRAVKQDPDYNYRSGHGLGIQQQQHSMNAGAYKHTTVIPSVQARPAPMSIHHILSDDTTHGSEQDRFSFRSDDDDDEEMDRYSETMDRNYGYGSSPTAPYSSSSKAPQKRKQGEENDGEPKKRKRISKKQAAEMGLLGPDSAVKRKRTKKIREPGYVSPTGFTHGGERVVQEPEEVVVLEPDIGPVSVLDHQSLPKIIWKGYPLNISGKIGFELLHPYEVHIASTLRLSPAQYLACKRTLILASRKYLSVPNGKQFKKSDAQKLCRIDVNKTSRLWEIFAKVGWLAGITEQDI